MHLRFLLTADPTGYQYASAIQCQLLAQTRSYLASRAISCYICLRIIEVNQPIDDPSASTRCQARDTEARETWVAAPPGSGVWGLPWSHSTYRQHESAWARRSSAQIL